MRTVVALLALLGCKSEPSVHRGSCQAAALCEDYESKDKKFVDGQRASCTGTWSANACPTTNRLGSCRESHGWTRTRHHYAGTTLDLERTKIECGAYGTWLSP